MTEPFHGEGSAPGNFFVSVLIRIEYEHERIILDSQYKPDGLNDGPVFTDKEIAFVQKLLANALLRRRRGHSLK